MELLEVVSRLVVSAVLLTSGAAKLRNGRAFRESVVALGVPLPLVGAVRVLLPPAELALGLGMLLSSTSRAASAAAAVLFLAFTVLVAANLARGNRPDCQCFGGLSGTPISTHTLVRNLVLVALSAVPAFGEPVGLVTSVRDSPPVEVLLVVAAAVAVSLALVFSHVVARRLRRPARTSSPLTGLVLHDPAGGRAVPASDLVDGRRPVLLVFVSPGCGSCAQLAPSVRAWSGSAFAEVVRVVPVVSDSARSDGVEIFGQAVLLDAGRAVRSALGAGSSPSAALIGPDGRLVTDVASGAREVRALLAAALAEVDTGPASPEDLLVLRPESVVRRRGTVTESSDGGQPPGTVLTEETSGAVLALDAIGSLIWSCLDGQASLADAVDDLAAVFGVDPSLIRDEVLEATRELGRQGFVTLVRTPRRLRGAAVISAP